MNEPDESWPRGESGRRTGLKIPGSVMEREGSNPFEAIYDHIHISF